MGIKTRSSRGPSVGGSSGGGIWEPAPTEFTDRKVLMSIWGPTGSGRTSLALTAPGPIKFAHAGEKIAGVINRYSRDKDIRVMNFGCILSGSAQEMSDQASPHWSKLESGVKESLHDGSTRSMIVDTDTEAWELIRMAFFGELNPKGRTDSLYGPVNGRWRSMWKAARAQDLCNFIVIGQAKDEYVQVTKDGRKSSEKSGRLIQAGQKEVAYMSDVVIETSRDYENGDFIATIRKGWWNAANTEGLEFRNQEIRFSNIMAVITETEESEWE